METLIKIIINISLILGSGYCAKEFLFNAEKIAASRIEKGFSSSEEIFRRLTSNKLPF